LWLSHHFRPPSDHETGHQPGSQRRPSKLIARPQQGSDHDDGTRGDRQATDGLTRGRVCEFERIGSFETANDGAALGRFNGGLSKAIRMYNRVEDTIGDIEDIDE